ncbi:uncharacterized protein LAESUDRAFT_762153 [Laetiporus sulphureus 93-53]|uniref:Uncharacterized protein n=1 Tax=Laetiporus sulphureus 93-53 TaxID=1314785 RepID=A0A165CP62_9APHY|nr:uncharacterized protein LAESUDRAFT_762153 [Laetiporus sulphureus 93-53]KZT03163.1 hypothetical protein LAESUDRAFT_762153 [Laetiporus sulphureus 93-53]
MAFAGDLHFNPLTDTLIDSDGKPLKFSSPTGKELPRKGYDPGLDIFQPPPKDRASEQVAVDPKSDRLQILKPFAPWDGKTENCLISAINAENGEADKVKNQGSSSAITTTVKAPRVSTLRSSRVSSAVSLSSLARIHEKNLKKQSMLALAFANLADYDKVQLDGRLSIHGLQDFQPGKNLTLALKHKDGSKDEIPLAHSFNEGQN